MKKSTKALLLSAFVCPGAGHLLLNKKHIGFALMAASFLALFVITSKAVEKAKVISVQIANGEVPYDMEVIKDLIAKSQTPQEIQLINLMTLVFIFAWVIGVFDSYRTAKMQETSNSTFEA